MKVVFNMLHSLSAIGHLRGGNEQLERTEQVSIHEQYSFGGENNIFLTTAHIICLLWRLLF